MTWLSQPYFRQSPCASGGVVSNTDASDILILRSGETKSEIFEELQIVKPDQFNRVKVGREQRSVEYEKKCLAAQGIEITEDGEEYHVPRIYPKRNGGKTLLSGNVYCGHCGGRIFASTARRSHHPVASGPNRVSIYKCYNRTQHRELCDGSTTYQAEKVDAVIDELLRTIFDRAKRVNEREFLDQQIRTTTTQYQQQLKRAKAEYAKCTKELSKWEGLMLDSLEGNCVFTPEQVKKGMETAQEKSNSLLEQITTLQTQAEDAKATAMEIEEQHQRLLSWADMYASASQDEKKIVASYIISEVRISRGYQLQVKFNISEAQYLSGMEMG